MLQRKHSLLRVYRHELVRFVALAMGVLGLYQLAMAQPSGQKTFPSPAEASQALFLAFQSGDEKTLMEIFGPSGKEVVSSGDEVEDKKSRDEFVQKYQEMNRWVKEPDGAMILYIGATNWPMPIPLVHKGSAWYFDTDAGKEEIVFRRIGRNELTAIQVCHELVDAQKEYYAQPRDGEVKQYAQKLDSDENKHNGLYWKTVQDEPESPIGPLVAYASSEGYAKDQSIGPNPFEGYYYRILTRQGKKAAGGAKNYRVNGQMTGGFAFLAYPAEYGVSGVMTFMVNQDGVVYEKDLGPKTADRVKSVNAYSPDKTWKRVE